MLGAVLYPLRWNPNDDSFPLSTYPMFSRPQPTPRVTVTYALGIEADGRRHHLAPELVANQEVLQARAVLTRAVATGRAGAVRLCQRIARRVAGAGGTLAPVVEVRIVRGTHDAVAYLTGRDRQGKEKVEARCPVERP